MPLYEPRTKTQPKRKTRTVSLTLTLWDGLEAVRLHEEALLRKAGDKKFVSINGVIERILELYVREHSEDAAASALKRRKTSRR